MDGRVGGKRQRVGERENKGRKSKEGERWQVGKGSWSGRNRRPGKADSVGRAEGVKGGGGREEEREKGGKARAGVRDASQNQVRIFVWRFSLSLSARLRNDTGGEG